MQDRMSQLGSDYWTPVNLNGPLPRIAAVRRTWLEIHEDGLRLLRSSATASARSQRHALALYEEMLADIRAVIPPAERNDRAAYNEANVRMVLAIQATRSAFEREGAGRICDFAI
jgi:hypothetical protein